MNHCKRVLAGLALLLCAQSGVAHAQSATQKFTIERFRLSLDKHGIFGVESGEVPKHMHFEVSAWFGYEDDPLVLNSSITGERVGALVSDRIAGSLVLSLGLWDRVQLGLSVPFVASQNDDNLAPVMQSTLSGAGIGDIRVVPKIMVLGGGLGKTSLAIIPSFSVPSAGADDYRGTDGFSFQPELALSHREERFRLGLNLLFASAKKEGIAGLKVDDQLSLRLGAAVEVVDNLDLGLTYQLATLAKDPFDDTQDAVMEIIGGPTYTINDKFTVFGAGGYGIDNGYGTPDWRALLGLRFHPGDAGITEEQAVEQVVSDTDGDGLVDSEDKCPEVAENFNGVEDEDGCPEEEKIDEPAKSVDGDGDGVPDELDRCPAAPEDVDDFEDSDGCPDEDNDGDGVLDAADNCALEKGPAGNRGCPWPDGDGDGVADKFDNCPTEPGDAANQGCKTKQLVKVTGGTIDILDRVFFKTNKAKILAKSYPLLDNVAAVLKSHSEITSIEVEGHTDSRGSDKANKRLSQRRADAVVKYLVRKGVAKNRLKGIGYGEEKPIETNDTDEGRSANRRVEFKIAGGEGVQTNASGPSKDSMDGN